MNTTSNLQNTFTPLKIQNRDAVRGEGGDGPRKLVAGDGQTNRQAASVNKIMDKL